MGNETNTAAGTEPQNTAQAGANTGAANEAQNEPPCDERVEPVSEVRGKVGETPDENSGAAESDCDDFEEKEEISMTM